MQKLLNRIAWFVSLFMWYMVVIAFIDLFWWYHSWSIFWWAIVWIIFKKIFLSEEFIKSRLEFFADAIAYRIWESKIESKKKVKKEEIKKVEDKDEIPEFKLNDIESYENHKNVDVSWLEETQIVKPVLNTALNNRKNNNEEDLKEEDLFKPSRFEVFIKDFFSENILAKLWWIIIFIWVLFLIWWVYWKIWPIWRIIIWFAIWFAIYFTWSIIEKKWFDNESRILMWIWILINYAVILGWRYILVDDNSWNELLSSWVTFIFLILNTIFAILTSLVYKSDSMLFFSFIFALLNPILVWWWLDNTFVLVWYSLIVSFWWLYLAKKESILYLAITIFILSNFLFLIADVWSDIEWVVKMVSSTIVSIASIFTIYKIEKSYLSGIFIWSYLFLALILWTWWEYLKESLSFVSYMAVIMLYFGLGIFYFLKTWFESLIIILFSPLLIILWLSYAWVIYSIPLVLAIMVLVYLFGFSFISKSANSTMKYAFLIILWIYIILTNSYLSLSIWHIELNLVNFITTLVVSFTFILTSYQLSRKEDLSFLYSIWTIWWIFILAPILTSSDKDSAMFGLSIISVILFWVSNLILPFLNKNLIENWDNLKNLIIWLISWVLFIWYEIFKYWNTYFPGVTMWYAYLWLSLLYFWFAYLAVNSIWFPKIKKDESSRNVIYAYLWITISLFSLAIAIVFSEFDKIWSAIVGTIWIFESTLLYYFYSKTKENKIALAATILFVIWILKSFILLDIVWQKDYFTLVPLSIVFISMVLNIKYTNYEKTWIKITHDILHILWAIVLGLLLVKIIPNTNHWWSTFGISLFLLIISSVYYYYDSKILKYFFLAWFVGFWIYQISSFNYITYRLDNDWLNYLIVLQYISTVILWVSTYIWNKINSDKQNQNVINIFFLFYLLIITTQYIHNIFDNLFAITVYWWILGSTLILKWIWNDIIKLRTIWLYLLSLTILKIFFIDIGAGLENTWARILAFIFVWVLLIFISTRYTKKYWDNILWEFNVWNLFDDPDKNINDTPIVNNQIKDIDVSDIKFVEYTIGAKKIKIRAVNLIKMSKLVISMYDWKTIFEKWELKNVYEYIKSNYKSDLSKANYDKIVAILDEFVEKWWEVKFIYN